MTKPYPFREPPPMTAMGHLAQAHATTWPKFCDLYIAELERVMAHSSQFRSATVVHDPEGQDPTISNVESDVVVLQAAHRALEIIYDRCQAALNRTYTQEAAEMVWLAVGVAKSMWLANGQLDLLLEVYHSGEWARRKTLTLIEFAAMTLGESMRWLGRDKVRDVVRQTLAMRKPCVDADTAAAIIGCERTSLKHLRQRDVGGIRGWQEPSRRRKWYYTVESVLGCDMQRIHKNKGRKRS